MVVVALFLTGTLENLPEPTLAAIVIVAISGMEALITLKDVCGLDPADGRRSLEWAARTLVQAVMRSPKLSAD